VTVIGTNEGMGNLMENGVLNLIPGVVSFDKMDGQLNGPTGVHAQPHRLLATVEGEPPVPQTVV
jgi:hypothetical protein